MTKNNKEYIILTKIIFQDHIGLIMKHLLTIRLVKNGKTDTYIIMFALFLTKKNIYIKIWSFFNLEDI